MPDNLTRSLVRRIDQLRSHDLSPETLHQAKRCLLDYLGAAFAGATLLRRQASTLLEMDRSQPNTASVIGFGVRAGLQTATLINGLTSHVAEMDDGVRFGMIHPGSPVISALLPAAERFDVCGDDLLIGIVLGYETALRIASSIQPSHYERGFHPSATCGAIGAAVGLSGMLGFDLGQIENALAAASVSAGGSLKVIGGRSELKPYNTAQAAVSGLMAAMMARAGFSGPDDALSGKTGFLAMTSDTCVASRVLDDCPAGLWIHQVYVKPYAACRHAHPAIEGCLRLRQEARFDLANVREIRVITYGGLRGRHDHRTADCVSSAKMSIPFSAALALVRGRAGIADFSEETLNDQDVKSLSGRVTVIEDPALTAQVPDQRAARIEIVTSQGDVLSASTTYPKGEPENPMSDRDLEAKFNELALSGGVSPERAERIRRFVWRLPAGLSDLFAEL